MIRSGALIADNAGALLRRVTIERSDPGPRPRVFSLARRHEFTGVVAAVGSDVSRPRPRPVGFTELMAAAIADEGLIELRRLAEEQAALRRVATLVARGPSPEEVFTAVAEEVGRLLDAEFTILSRHEPPGDQVSGVQG